ncbi:MAG: hypothetical protein IJD31_04185 [Lachnospiraceae bacterium]|nr:hypothetical protein [Lachnospiraceae bacterium]
MEKKQERKNFIFTKPGAVVLTIITAFLIAGAVVAMDFGFGFGWFF